MMYLTFNVTPAPNAVSRLFPFQLCEWLHCFLFPGHAVFKLCRHSDEAVAKEAEALYKKWRSHFEEFQDRPQIEVKCDEKSERIRDSGRKFLAESLKLEVRVGGSF